jgi:hypothetical protein
MLPNPFTEVAGDPDIQCTVSSASQNIEGWLLRKHTVKWIPVFTGMTDCALGFTIHGMAECAPGFFSTGTVVIPAQAGIQSLIPHRIKWIPVFTGMADCRLDSRVHDNDGCLI